MDFGINVATAADSWTVVARAEALGFSHAWFFDTQMINADVFVAMAAAAMRTRRIKLCAGVLIPSNRIAPVAANALASLNKLAPGRIQCGVATGFTARRTMGVGAMRLGDVKEYIRVMRGLLARETVEWEFEGARRKIRFLNPDLELIDTTHPIRFHFSAFGPKGKAMAAEIGIDWLVPVRDQAFALAQIEGMKTAWRAAGRDPATLYASAHASGCILRPGEGWDSRRVLEQGGPTASMILHDLVEADAFGSIGLRVPEPLRPALEAYRKIYEAYEPADARYLSVHRGHLMIVRPEEEHLITGEMLKALSFSGTPDELRARIRAIADAGYSQFAAHIRYGHDAMIEDWAELLGTV